MTDFFLVTKHEGAVYRHFFIFYWLICWNLI